MIVPQKLKPSRTLPVGLSRESVAAPLAPGSPSLPARLAARVRARALDRALLAGADPLESSELAARARMLTSRRFRRSTAEGLERWLAAADWPRSRRRVLPPRVLAADHAAEVREMVALLRGPAPLYACGVAWVTELFTDGTGPAYDVNGEAFAAQLHGARAALAGESRRHGRAISPAAGRRSPELSR